MIGESDSTHCDEVSWRFLPWDSAKLVVGVGNRDGASLMGCYNARPRRIMTNLTGVVRQLQKEGQRAGCGDE